MSLVLDSDVTLPTISPTVSLLSDLQQITATPHSTFLGDSDSDAHDSVFLSLGNDTQTANSSSTSTASPSSYTSLASSGMQVPTSKCSLAMCAMVLFSMLSSL